MRAAGCHPARTLSPSSADVHHPHLPRAFALCSRCGRYSTYALTDDLHILLQLYRLGDVPTFLPNREHTSSSPVLTRPTSDSNTSALFPLFSLPTIYQIIRIKKHTQHMNTPPQFPSLRFQLPIFLTHSKAHYITCHSCAVYVTPQRIYLGKKGFALALFASPPPSEQTLRTIRARMHVCGHTTLLSD